jgi:capsular polysaccharide biosynthesis protein
MSSSKYRIVEPAKLPSGPYKPNRKKIALMGVLLGFVIGGAAALLVELLDNSFKKVEDVEDVLGLPVLGVTPKAPFLKKIAR